MSGICGTCDTAWCPWRSDMVLDCSHYTPKSETNWERLFGTPERAARTWIEFNGIYRCADCPICHDEMGVTCEIPGECAWEDEEGGYDALLEWLGGDA